MRYLERFVAPILVVAVCIFAIFPLLNSYFYPMHDDEQIARLYDLNAALLSGNIPPRIAPNLGFGYGYPFFNFYPAFAYYIGELYHLLGFGFILSTKMMLITGFVLSALFMYFFSKEILGKLGGVVAAVSYTYISYKAVDVYVRGAYAEFFAFVFIPLIFWSIYKLAKSENLKFVIIGALSTAGLILSHELVALMSNIFVPIWILYSLYLSENKIRFLLRIAGMLLLGFGLSAYFFLPSYFEKGYTLVNILTTELADYRLHFVCVYQLWDSVWGYGGSIPGCNDGLSFEIGKIQIILSVFSVLLAILSYVKQKRIRYVIPILVFSIMFLISIFMMVKYSGTVWNLVPALWYVQFPWRFLIFSGFFASFLTGSIIIFIKGKVLRYIFATVIVIPLIILNISRFTPQRFINVSDSYYTSPNKIKWDTSLLSYEYVPLGISTKKSKQGTTQININKNEISTSSANIIKGKMHITTVKDLPQYKKLDVESFGNSILQVNTYSFPGWVVYLDESRISFSDNNKLKLIRVNVPSGKHVIEAKFLDTPVRTVGNILSVISIIILGFLIIFSFRPELRHEKNS